MEAPRTSSLASAGQWIGRFFLIAILAAAVALAIFAVLHVVRTDQTVARKVGARIPVETAVVKVATIEEVIGASGGLRPNDLISLTARLGQKVLRVPVDVGQVVKQDDVLLELDDRLLKATVRSAEQAVNLTDITRANAAAQLQRFQTLFDRKMAASADLEAARAALAKAEQDRAAAAQALAQAQVDLENAVVKAPAACIVLDRTVNPGESTQIGQPIFRLGTLDNVLMMAEVAQEKIGSVTLGLHGEVGFNAYPGEIFQGEVVKIDPNTNPATHTFPAFLRIANPGWRLKPGLTGFARIQRKKTTLSVPSVAVLNPIGDRASVFVVDADSRARQREVRTGASGGGLTEVLAGLQEGDRVVTVGQLGLKEYDLVPR